MRRVRSIHLKFLKSRESEREREREGGQIYEDEGRSTSSHQDVEDSAEISSRLARMIDGDKN